ncbi:MAG TPA: efflux RND transporter periplasmic adaptor subunit, partial [Steroidobacteraceae bacterium]|nr:efflux RND transporter periplasmic adaptor subunit [Steroidobacteraceae bacterium]
MTKDPQTFMRHRAVAALAAGLVIAACSHSSPPTQQATPAQGLKTVAIEPARVAVETSFDGVIEAVNQATVAAQTSGRVLELPYDVGDYVEKGSVIVRLRDTEQRARADSATAAFTDAQARLAEAQLAYDRIKDLFDKNMVAKAAYDKATADLKSAKARVEAASSAAQEAQEGLGYTTLRAPYSGIVVSRQIEVGEIAAVGQPLMTGLSLEELRAVVDIPQEHIGPLRKHKEARIALADGRWITATQVRIAPSADPKTQSFLVHVVLPKGDYGLFPGTLVKVAFTTGDAEQLLAPASSVVQRGEITGIYVVGADGKVGFRYIRAGTVAP